MNKKLHSMAIIAAAISSRNGMSDINQLVDDAARRSRNKQNKRRYYAINPESQKRSSSNK